MSAVVQSKLVSAPALPLLADAELARCFAWRNGAPVSAEEFIADVQALAKLLPPAHYAVNLCQDRYRFLVAFCAVALAGQTNLLPSSRSPQTIAETLHAYPGSYALSEPALEPEPSRQFVLPASLVAPACGSMPDIAA